MTVHLLAISGSLRAGSYNTMVARAAAGLAPAGVTVEVAELVRDLPLYDQDLDVEPLSPAVADLRRRIGEAGGVLLVTPEYNYSIPGGLKNLLDWASRPFGKHCMMGKPVAVIGAGPGSRGGKASVEYLRSVLPALGAELVGDELLLAKVDTQLDPADGTPGEELAVQLGTVVTALAAAARAQAGLA